MRFAQPADLQQPGVAITMYGYSPWPKEAILRTVLAGGRISELPGDFVLVATTKGGERHLIVTSVLGIRPYFYIDAPGPAVHGNDVFELVARADLPWTWDLDALRAVAWFGHTVGAQTLHPRVRRVPPASIMVHDGSGWRVETEPFWREIFHAPRITTDDAVDVFNVVMDELIARQPVVSLSGGFDSRAILSRALAVGYRPEVITMGYPDSTDLRVARRIAGDHCLKHTCVALAVDDYFRNAALIVRLTGGTKTVANWHTFLYCQGRERSEPNLNGTNGDIAKTYLHLDRGRLAHLADRGGGLTVRAYWAARIGRRFLRMAGFLPFLGPGGVGDAMAFSQRSIEPAIADKGKALDILDRFFGTQRVRHFHGNGFSLLGYHTAPASPFLDSRFIAAAAALPRTAKLGNNFHRRLIQRNAPSLMNYPVNGEPTVYPSAPARYWRGSQSPNTPYSPLDRVYGDPRATEILRDSPHLAEFLAKAERKRVVESGTVAVKNFLITLHFAASVAATPRHPTDAPASMR
jgi:Asparagine synthase